MRISRRFRVIFYTFHQRFNADANILCFVDSSRRVVEAADNVVHAYDMNMGVPDAPSSASEEEPESSKNRQPYIVVTGDNIPINFNPQGGKRRRNSVDLARRSSKRRQFPRHSSPQPGLPSQQAEINDQPASQNDDGSDGDIEMDVDMTARAHDGTVLATPDQFVTPGLRHTNLRDVLQFLVNDLLKVGGRPESAMANEIDGGEEIEVRVRQPNGDGEGQSDQLVCGP